MNVICKFIWTEQVGVDVSNYYFGVVKDWSIGQGGKPVAITVCTSDDGWAVDLIEGRWYEIELDPNGDPIRAREVPDPFAAPVSTATNTKSTECQTTEEPA